MTDRMRHLPCGQAVNSNQQAVGLLYRERGGGAYMHMRRTNETTGRRPVVPGKRRSSIYAPPAEDMNETS